MNTSMAGAMFLHAQSGGNTVQTRPALYKLDRAKDVGNRTEDTPFI